MRGIDDTLQPDLIEMQQFERVNRGYRYVLIAIEVFLKRKYAEPLKEKRRTEAMEKIFNRVGARVRNLHTDDGKEFFNSTMKRLLTQYGNVNHYSTYSVNKASIQRKL